MRMWIGIAALTAAVACGGDDPGKDDTDTDPTDDTDTDGNPEDTDGPEDTDVDSPTDTDDPDTADTGTTLGRALGCAPDYALVMEPVYDDCMSVQSAIDPSTGKVYETTTVNYGPDGEVLTYHFVSKADGTEVLYAYEYDAAGDTQTVTVDDGADGTVETTYDLVRTFDAGGGLTQLVTTETSDSGTSVETVDYTLGACGVERVAYDFETDGVTDYSATNTWFVDGSRSEEDEGDDGSIERTADRYVDPATGQPVSYEAEYFAPNGVPDYWYDYTSYDANGNLLAIEGEQALDSYGPTYYGYAYEIEASWMYDADNREVASVVTYSVLGQVVFAEAKETVWTCPP